MENFIVASELNSFFKNSTDQGALTSLLQDFFCVCVGCCLICVVVGEVIVVMDGGKCCTGCDCFRPIDDATGFWSTLLRGSGCCIESNRIYSS